MNDYKYIPDSIKNQANTIFNKDERLNTTVSNTDIQTSTFDMSFRHLTSFDSGKLVPIFTEEALPGDIFNITTSTLIKMSSPQAPTMESAIYDVSFFFVPNRIIYPFWKEFQGENKSSGFQPDYKTLPVVVLYNTDKYTADDLAAYIGIPQNVPLNAGVEGISDGIFQFSALPFKAYIEIWNQFYRDQNLQAEIDNTNNNKPTENVDAINYWNQPYNKSLQVGQKLAPTSKLPDYFTTCLPYQQKGAPVKIPLGDYAPISNGILGTQKSNFIQPNIYNANQELNTENSVLSTNNGRLTGSTNTGQEPNREMWLNMVADLSQVQNLTVTDLRLYITLQQIRELDARSGTRYIEILKSHWGIEISEETVQRPEYIGGFRGNININTVVQNSSSVNNSPLGNTGGVSISNMTQPNAVNYAVKEHGIIWGLITLRPQINYSQGIPRWLTRIVKEDFYDPIYANISEQPVYKQELFANGELNGNQDIFGYQEAWADYRHTQNKLSGYLSVNNPTSLSTLYSYTEKYTTHPTLSGLWMEANKNIIGNTLLLNGDILEYTHQFLADFYFDLKITRRLPMYSIPGIEKI